jgi:dTDP-4-amino-4,6-dideoxygalactose transaminase
VTTSSAPETGDVLLPAAASEAPPSTSPTSAALIAPVGVSPTPQGTIPLSTPSFGWRDQMALWCGTAGAMRRADDSALQRFETCVAARTGSAAAMATTSGSAALHLALQVLGVRAGDTVVVPMLAPYEVVAPILWLGATPMLVDVEASSWTLSPRLLEQRLTLANGRMPRAAIAVDLYGQTCDYAALLPICSRFRIPVLEDASEAMGATWRDRDAGGLGTLGVVSFGANKIASTGAGGAVLCRDLALLSHAHRLVGLAPMREQTQDRQHLGSRMSPVLALLGNAQIARLDALIDERRRVAHRYARLLSALPGIAVVPEVPWGRSSRWLSVITVNAAEFGASAAEVCVALRESGIEARPVWQPLQHQRDLATAERVGGEVAQRLASTGLCLPSGASIDPQAQDRVAQAIRRCQRA